MARRKRVYLDTSVLGHWILYYTIPKEQQDKATRNVRRSLMLLDGIQRGLFSCQFETSDFALAELLQSLRDNILADKLKREGHSLVYFRELKDHEVLEMDEKRDLEAHMGRFEAFFDEINVHVYEIWVELNAVSYLTMNYAIDSSDAVQVAWAGRWCDYFTTGDRRLLDLKPKIGKLLVVLPSRLHAIRELRRQV